MVHGLYLHVNARNRFTNKDLMSSPFCCDEGAISCSFWRGWREGGPKTGRSGKHHVDPLTCLSGDFVRRPCAKGSRWAPCPFEITDEVEIQSPDEKRLARRSVGVGYCCPPGLPVLGVARRKGCTGAWLAGRLCEGWSIAHQGRFPLRCFGVVLPMDERGGRSTLVALVGPAGMGFAALPLWLTACLRLWHFSYLTTNIEIICFSWKTAKTSERLIVSQVIFSIQIELNGSWKQLYIKLQQIYVVFRPTQANINASVTW